MDNFDCTKMNACFQKFTACLREGLIHERKQALLAPPLPLMLPRICSTHNCSSALFSNNNGIYSIARSRMGSSFSHGWSSSACSWFGSSSARSIRFSIAHSFCVPELHGSLLYTPSVSSQNRRFGSQTVGVPLQSVSGTAEGRSNKHLKAYEETFNYLTNCSQNSEFGNKYGLRNNLRAPNFKDLGGGG